MFLYEFQLQYIKSVESKTDAFLTQNCSSCQPALVHSSLYLTSESASESNMFSIFSWKITLSTEIGFSSLSLTCTHTRAHIHSEFHLHAHTHTHAPPSLPLQHTHARHALFSSNISGWMKWMAHLWSWPIISFLDPLLLLLPTSTAPPPPLCLHLKTSGGSRTFGQGGENSI